MCLGRHRHVFIFFARKTLANLGKKNSPILIEKHASWRRPRKMTDRDLKKKHHRMTPIEHFLIDIIQILFRDWKENTIADISRCKAATDIFQPTLCNFFYKRWWIIFFYGRGCVFVRCCHKIYNVGRLGFNVRAQPKFCLDRHRHVFIFFARKTLANLGKNTRFTDINRKTC